MSATTILTLACRRAPSFKEVQCIAADRDHRSITNMMDVLVCNQSVRVGALIQDRVDAVVDIEKKTK